MAHEPKTFTPWTFTEVCQRLLLHLNETEPLHRAVCKPCRVGCPRSSPGFAQLTPARALRFNWGDMLLPNAGSQPLIFYKNLGNRDVYFSQMSI